ncbi:MAG: cysteine--tRNA ligase [Gammaproteobacteria bacterium]|nr:cysteine--tRNA ligase [Gammaproteobacteria bacterium]MBQ0840971.1 cysteine--tRNA ligase [Gammaproteobacteria bacterium]
MPLQLYNTLTRKKDLFKPLKPGKIDLYVCGITVYDYCHIGHARVLVAFDAITRYLRSQGWDVNYVRNITDIDDKILRRADENKELYTDLTERMIAAMHEDERALGVLPPSIEPRATGHMDDIIDMVQILVDNHYAYRADNGDVYYRVKRFPNYGKLSNKNPDELLSGARVEVRDVKEDPRDFALWKAADESEAGWPSPWSYGRPGWHIECSAMSTCLLGETFDIHGGGPDLPFPHHENEIAQSEAATGKHFVNYWMHAGAVRVDNEKMSKSLNNFFTIRDVLEKYHPEVVRYFLLSSHYRSPINYSEANLIEARQGLERFYFALQNFAEVAPTPLADLQGSAYYQRFVAAMDDDFNTREAFSAMYELVRELNTVAREDQHQAQVMVGELKALGGILGVLEADPQAFLKGSAQDSSGLADADIDALIGEREAAKLNKDYARADAVREELKEQGIVLEDSREGTRWRRA